MTKEEVLGYLKNDLADSRKALELAKAEKVTATFKYNQGRIDGFEMAISLVERLDG